MVGVVPDDDARWNRLNNYYYNCIKDVDNNILEILNELDDLGIAENTIVIFTADHGELAGAGRPAQGRSDATYSGIRKCLDEWSGFLRSPLPLSLSGWSVKSR